MDAEHADFTIKLHSAHVKNDGQVRLIINNFSDALQTYQVQASHPTDLLQFSPASQAIRVAPNEQDEVSIEVWATNQSLLKPSQWWAHYNFDVVVTNGAGKQSVRAHLSTTPPPHVWYTVMSLLILLLGTSILVYLFLLREDVAEGTGLAATIVVEQETRIAIEETEHEALRATEERASPFPTESAADGDTAESSGETATDPPPPPPTPTPVIVRVRQLAPPFIPTIQEDGELRIDLIFENQTDNIGILLTEQPHNNVLTQPTNGVLEKQDGDGVYIYRPNANYFGPDHFDYRLCETLKPTNCADGRVTLIIEPVNDPPIADDDTVIINAGGGPQDITAQLYNGDQDEENLPFSIVSVQDSGSGRVSLTPNTGTVLYDPGDDFASLAAGELATVDSFQYTIQDAQGVRSQPATVTVQALGRNDAPIAQDDVLSGLVSEDGLSVDLTSSLLANDTDPDVLQQSELAIHTVTNDSVGGGVTQIDGGLFYDPSGAYESLGADETAVDTFTYTIIDPDGMVSNAATAQIVISGVSDAPTLAISNPTNPVIFSPVGSTTTSVNIASNVTITDFDSSNLGKILIEHFGIGTRPDGSEEYIAFTFNGTTYDSSHEDYAITPLVPTSIEGFITAVQSTVYINTATTPTPGCRRIEFQVFDEVDVGSNEIVINIQVGNTVCPTASLLPKQKLTMRGQLS